MTTASILNASLSDAPVVPVLTIEKAEDAPELGKALARGGVTTVEITLRTAEGLDAISNMKRACPDLLVGAGTVLNPKDLDDALEAGSDFIVTPGATPALLKAAQESGALFIPGVATPSEALFAYEHGFSMLKLFPAEVVGGVNMLKAIYGPMPQLTFMPTGGVRADTMNRFLELPNVACVGGTWLASKSDVDNNDWSGIEARSKEAIQTAQT